MRNFNQVTNRMFSAIKQTVVKSGEERSFLSSPFNIIKRRKSVLLILICFLIFTACQEEKKDVFHFTVAQANSKNPRNSEADIIELKDGRLLLGWSEFYGESSADDGNARIVGRISGDGGRTWGEKYTLVEHEGGRNVMEVNFLRLKNGDIALFHFKKYDEVADSTWNNSTSKTGDCRLVMRISKDEGKTFTFSKEITEENRYLESANGRGIRLKSGRILIECDDYFGNAFSMYSDDEGETWHEGQLVKPLKGRCWEPGAVELKNGDVLMFLRTELGGQYQTISKDGGETWSEPTATALKGSAAPISIERIPNTGDLLAIWNHDVASISNGYRDENVKNKKRSRNPLTSAISKDEGKTWKNFRNIEDAPDDAWAYPAVTWVENRAIITYFNYNGGLSLKLKGLPEEWFYQKN